MIILPCIILFLLITFSAISDHISMPLGQLFDLYVLPFAYNFLKTNIFAYNFLNKINYIIKFVYLVIMLLSINVCKKISFRSSIFTSVNLRFIALQSNSEPLSKISLML